MNAHPLKRAIRLFQIGDDAAVRALGPLAEAEPNGRPKANLMRLIGLAALRAGDAEEAKVWLTRANGLFGEKDIAARAALGGALLASGAFDEAQVLFRTVLAQAPNAVAAAIGLARALEELGDSAGALSAWRQAMAGLITLTPAAADEWMLGLPPNITRLPLQTMAQAVGSAGDEACAHRLRHRLQTLFPDARTRTQAPPSQAPQALETAGPLGAPVRSPDSGHGLMLETANAGAPQDLMEQARQAGREGHTETARILYRNVGNLVTCAPSPLDDDLAALALDAIAALRSMGDTATAATLLDQMFEHRPNDPAVITQRVLALRDAGDIKGALAAIEAARESPGFATNGPLLAVWASLLSGQGRPDDTMAVAEGAITANPKESEAWRTLAQAHEQAGRLDDALMASHGAVIRNPSFAWGHGLIARLLEQRNQIDPAIARYRLAQAIDPGNPDAHLALALALLKRGDWEEGWDAYEWRLPKTGRPAGTFSAPAWNGQALDGRTLLICHERQGVAEALMFLRLAPAAGRQAGGSLVLEVDRRMVPLVTRAMPDATVVAAADPPAPETRTSDIAAQAPFASLPRLTGPDPAAGVTPAPTIAADETRVTALRAQYLAMSDTPARLLVGLSWTPLDARKYPDRVAPWSDWAPLFAVPGVRFVSVQPGAVESDLDRLKTELKADVIRDPVIDTDSADLDGRAAQVAAMDMVITIDGLIAHLAGALAVPGIVLLPFTPDWRWGLSGTRSVWHPSLRLARQTMPGDWSGPMRRAALALGGYRDAAQASRDSA